jgi:menaquinone-dependent protoporphyrinogen oxidase
MRVLVTAASRHGATGEIAEAIGEVLVGQGLEVDVLSPEKVDSLEGYDAVLLGSAVYTGHWLESALELVRRSADELAARPVWLFSSGPVGDPSGRFARQMDVDPLDLPEILERTSAREHRIFAGRLEAGQGRLGRRLALAVFPGMKGDFRDWDEIRSWASEIGDALWSGAEQDRAGAGARPAAAP